MLLNKWQKSRRLKLYETDNIRTAESTKKGGMLSNMENNFVVPQFLKILFFESD